MIATRIAAGLFVLSVAGFYFGPAYKANPEYARSASAMAVLQEMQGAGLRDQVRVVRTSEPDLLTVTGQAGVHKNIAASGLLTEEDTSYSFKLLTKSHCFELEPGCLEIKQKSIVKAVSVKVLM